MFHSFLDFPNKQFFGYDRMMQLAKLLIKLREMKDERDVLGLDLTSEQKEFLKNLEDLEREQPSKNLLLEASYLLN